MKKPNFSPVSDPALKPIVNQLNGFLTSLTSQLTFDVGAVIFMGATNTLSGDVSKLFFDDNTGRLGIGKNTNLQAPLSIASEGASRGGGWKPAIEIEGNIRGIPSITFGGLVDGTFFGIVGIANTSGNDFTQALGEFYGLRQGNQSQWRFSLNDNIGTDIPIDIFALYSDGPAEFVGTAATILNRGTTAQRPPAVDGMIRFNTDTNRVEAYYSGIWNNL